MERPSPKDTDEDLLRFQAEFLKAKQAAESDDGKVGGQQSSSSIQLIRPIRRRPPQTPPKTPLTNKSVIEERPSNSSDGVTKKIIVEPQISDVLSLGQVSEKTFDSSFFELTNNLADESKPTNKKLPSKFAASRTNRTTTATGSGGFNKNNKKESLFMKRHKEEQEERSHLGGEKVQTVKFMPLSSTIPTAAAVLHTDNDQRRCSTVGSEMQRLKSEVDQENAGKLAAMTTEEILAEKQDLMKKLDPSIISLLRGRRGSEKHTTNDDLSSQENDVSVMTGNSSNVPNRCETTESGNPPSCCADESSSVMKEDSSSSSRRQSSSNQQLPDHIAKLFEGVDFSSLMQAAESEATAVESEKLEWMKEITTKGGNSYEPTTASGDDRSQENGNARFDFDGQLVSEHSASSSKGDPSLYHHGDEADVPGYTLSELEWLCLSRVQNQRVIACRTIGRVFAFAKRGVYDVPVISPALLPAVTMTAEPIAVTIRRLLDDNAPAVFTAALGALEALMVNITDEIFLDENLVGFGLMPQPLLTPDFRQNQSADGGAELLLSETQTMSRDVIDGLTRSNVIGRIGYVLRVLLSSSSSFDEDVRQRSCCGDDIQMAAVAAENHRRTMECALSVLNRIGRHSVEAGRKIVECPGLMKYLQGLCMDKSWTDPNRIMPSFLKLIRTLCMDKSVAIELASPEALGIASYIPGFIIRTPTDYENVNLNKCCRTILETYRLWSTMVVHGLLTELISDLFPALIAQINSVQSCNTVAVASNVPQFEIERYGHICLLLRTAIQRETSSSECQWQGILGLFKPILSSLCYLLSRINETSSTKTSTMRDDLIAESTVQSVASGIQCVLAYVTAFEGLDELDDGGGQLRKLLDTLYGKLSETWSIEDRSLYLNLTAEDLEALICRDPSSLPSLKSTTKLGSKIIAEHENYAAQVTAVMKSDTSTKQESRIRKLWFSHLEIGLLTNLCLLGIADKNDAYTKLAEQIARKDFEEHELLKASSAILRV